MNSLFCKHFSNLLSISRIYHLFRKFIFHYLSCHFIMNSLSFPRIYDAYSINFANEFWNKFGFCEFTVYPAEIPWMNNLSRSEFTFPEFTISLVNSLKINSLYREFSMNSRDVSRIRYEYTIYFTISLKIHSMFREYTINSVSISQVHFEFTIKSQNTMN